ncbi:MAG TPA: flagellar motor protein MotB [Stellaceae bacterium]|nr:flagellar motor protein MotB [Stellaceae bacterium]
MTRLGQRRREPASHADDWLMTYADMITLLLCFFVIFIIASHSGQSLQKQLPVPSMPAVTAQIPPAVQRPALSPEVSPVVRVSLPAHDIDSGDARVEFAAAAAATRVDAPSPPPKETETAAAAAAPVQAETVAVKADDAPNRALAVTPPPELVGTQTPQGASTSISTSANAAPKGDRITTFEMGSAAFFGSGSASLSDAGKGILRGILAPLTAALAEGYRIRVEGHTDDTPIDTPQFPSNWELSTARASAVVHFFLEQGVPAERLRAVGYADTEPKVPNRDAAGNPIPANQAENRRVVIKLEKVVTAAR